MDDLISRQAAIEAIGEKSDEIYKTKQKGATYPHDDFFQGMAYAEDVVKQLPPIQPVIIPCDYAKACNEATMDKLTSAVAYYDVLEELRKYGYVFVDMREVTT